ncbi:WbqC family protein [Methylogaea oryzae]|uniref:WbqC-like protein family protein n=1 Tax=Methylogaea oryzae TaxID=1295382 RepID=A0A8D5AIP8_9GAMM|nr:WbqC family protein [Methylogaea oryzae]BBL71576.1 hypothetical protein MoryE10_21820 [Methylogaea oryzae]
MKLAVMQPYLFPYLGYFQLVAAVDKFVFYDDVNFIKNGWINRNRLILAGQVRYFTVPLAGASAFQPINQVVVQPDGVWRRKIAASLKQSYAKAPSFEPIYDLACGILFSAERHIGQLAQNSVKAVADYLGLATQFAASTDAYHNTKLRGAARVLDICRQEGAEDYYNLPGGTALYDPALFEQRSIRLHFLQPELKPYRQFADAFHPALSILDVLMFHDRLAARELLRTEARP